jgi:hypothetical protein
MIIGSRVQPKATGIMGSGEDSKRSSRVRRMTSKRRGTTGTKGRVTGFDKLMDFVYLSYACILLVLGAGMLVTSIALLRRSTVGDSAVPPPKHHQQRRRESASSGEANKRDRLWGNEGSIWNHTRAILDSALPFDQSQMIHCSGRRTHDGNLGKRRLMRQPRTSVSSSHHHHRRLRMNSSGEVGSEFVEPETTKTTKPSAAAVSINSYVGIMPRPGEAGTAIFDGKEVSTFVKNWEMDCEEYGLTEAQKCRKFPRYCTREIGEVVEKLKGYEDGNWESFKVELKRLFWQADPPKNSIAALVKLLGEAKAGKMTVDMYVLKYTTITQELVDKNAMSTFDRNVRLLEGLSEGIL